MKEKTQKKYNKQLLIQQTLIFLLLNTQNNLIANIEKYNTNTRIQIFSNYQNINIITNTLTIIGNVVIQTNSINIYADKIIVTYSNKTKKEKTIDIYGNPVIFYQLKNKKNQILATSLHISYNRSNYTIILYGKVYLKRKNNILESTCIIYYIKEKYIKTCNNNKNHQTQTRLILTNNKIQNIN